MNPEIKDAWLAALRSGDYAQTTNHLRDENGMCCLGVLCNIAARHGIGTWQGDAFITLSDESHYSLPVEVVAWAGLASGYPFILDTSITDFNDGAKPYDDHQYSFTEIADLIEAHL